MNSYLVGDSQGSTACPEHHKFYFPILMLENQHPLIFTDSPVVPQGSLRHFIRSQESCPNVSVLIQIVEIQNLATLTYELTVFSSDGCVLQECPMLLNPEERILIVSLMNGMNYTATLEVSNDCGFNSTTILIQPGM